VAYGDGWYATHNAATAAFWIAEDYGWKVKWTRPTPDSPYRLRIYDPARLNPRGETLRPENGVVPMLY